MMYYSDENKEKLKQALEELEAASTENLKYLNPRPLKPGVEAPGPYDPAELKAAYERLENAIKAYGELEKESFY